MTFREKLTKEHPDKVGIRYDGCCSGCPYMYGYEKEEDRPCRYKSYDCTFCWGRAIPEKKTEHKISYNVAFDPNRLAARFGIRRDDMDALAYVAADMAVTKAIVSNRPTIKSVKFNPPATIIFWTDGTKTVVKCQEGDFYNAETGFALAYLKKLLGNDNTFNKEINKWVPEYLTDKEPISDPLEDVYKILMQVNGVNPNKVTKRQLLCILEEAARSIQKTWEDEAHG